MTKISVVVCTYNNLRLLEKTLLSLIHQTLKKNLYEILVVDNNSSDKTDSFVKSFQTNYALPVIRLIKEKEQGLGYARNKGVRFSKAEYVAFIDDDTRADKNWLKNASTIMDDKQLNLFACGGIILPAYEDIKPTWFKDEYEKRDWGKKERFLNKGEAFSGSNMIFRKDIIAKYGGFDITVGMKGDYLSVGEETSLFEKIWNTADVGDIFYYSPKLIVYHLVPSFKMTVFYQLKRSLVSGNAKFFRIESFNLLKRSVYFLLYLVALIIYFASAALLIIRYKENENWLIERFSPIFYYIGFELGLLGVYLRIKK